MSNLSALLKSLMHDKGVNVKDTSDGTGLSTVTIYDILNGVEKKPTPRTIRNIAEYFNISTQQLANLLTDSKTIKNLPSNISEILAYLMKEVYVSERELARACDVSQQSINKILSNQTKSPKPETLIKIADFFNVTVDELCGKVPLNPQRSKGSYNPSYKTLSIPMITWECLALLPEVLESAATTFNFKATSLCAEQYYALKIDKPDFAGRINTNDILILEYQGILENGVTCIIQNDSGIYLGDLLLKPDRKFLIPINFDDQIVKLSDGTYRSLGIIKEIIKDD